MEKNDKTKDLTESELASVTGGNTTNWCNTVSRQRTTEASCSKLAQNNPVCKLKWENNRCVFIGIDKSKEKNLFQTILGWLGL